MSKVEFHLSLHKNNVCLSKNNIGTQKTSFISHKIMKLTTFSIRHDRNYVCSFVGRNFGLCNVSLFCQLKYSLPICVISSRKIREKNLVSLS